MRRPPTLPCLLVALAGLASATAAEPASRVYTGTLGRQPVVLELTSDADTGPSGRYFYVRHHRDLLLMDGSGSGDRLQLSEGLDQAAPRPRLTLERQPDGGWRGQWRGPQGRTLPIALQPARPEAPAADAAGYLRQLYASDPYEYLRLSGLSLRPGPRERFMDHTLQWWVAPDSKIRLFEILDGYPPAQRERINRLLRDRLWQAIGDYYACMSGLRQPGDGDYEQTVTLRLLSAGLVSISVFTNYYCGGAHPDFGDAPINLDARTGTELALEDVLWVGQGPTFRYVRPDAAGAGPAGDAGFDTYADYRENVFAPWLVEQLARLYPAHMQADVQAGREDECGYGDPQVWQFVNWHMSPRGIFVGPSFARVARVCEANDDWSVLPWSIVRTHPGRLSLELP